MPIADPAPDTDVAGDLGKKDKRRIEQYLWIFPYVGTDDIQGGAQRDGNHEQRVQERVLNFRQDRVAFRHLGIEPLDVETAYPAIEVAVAQQYAKTITSMVM